MQLSPRMPEFGMREFHARFMAEKGVPGAGVSPRSLVLIIIFPPMLNICIYSSALDITHFTH
jgi:hypothetical protein